MKFSRAGRYGCCDTSLFLQIAIHAACCGCSLHIAIFRLLFAADAGIPYSFSSIETEVLRIDVNSYLSV